MGMGRYDQLSEYERQGEFVVGTSKILANAYLRSLGLTFDYVAEDSILSGSNVSSIPSRASGAGALSVSAGTLVAPVANSKFDGAKSLLFEAAQFMTAAGSPSFWRFAHAGPSDIFHVFAPTSNSAVSVLWATRPSSGAGAVCFRNTTTQAHHLLNSGSGTILNYAFGATALNTGTYIETTHDDAASSPKVTDYVLGVASSTDPSGAAGSSDPGSTFLLGSDGVSPASMEWVRTFGTARVLSAAERSNVRKALYSLYKLGAP